MNRPIFRAAARALVSNSRRFLSAPSSFYVRTHAANVLRVRAPLPSARFFSTNPGVLAKQAADCLTKVKSAETTMMNHDFSWVDLDPYLLDEVVAKTGECRDFLNSLTAAEVEAAEKINGVVSAIERTEDLLQTVIKCDDIATRLHHLSEQVEDIGTYGDGDNKPGAFKKEWEVETSRLLTEYSDLLETAKDGYVHRIEKELGYKFLLFKRAVHIESFRYYFPKVHPSGFSTSAD